MRRPDAAALLCGLCTALTALTAHTADTAPPEPAYRYRAAIEVQQSAAFVQLALPASAYTHSLQREALADLRIVDADGQRVPFALLPPRTTQAAAPQPAPPPQPAVLYPLPRQAAPAAGEPPSVAIELRGGQVRIKPIGPGTSPAEQPGATGSPGWLIDLGPRKQPRSGPRLLRLAWSGPAEFSAPFDLDLGDDLQHWQPANGGQLMALRSTARPLTQPDISLPANPPRYVRLLWREGATPPALTGAQLLAPALPARDDGADPPTPLSFSASPEPAGPTPSPHQHPAQQAAPGALHVDLGGRLPLVSLDLDVGAGTHVMPVRVQGRGRLDEPWREVARGVFYRLERGPQVSRSPPLALDGTALRYLRLATDERTAPLDPDRTQVLVQARLARLVFASQGRAPYTLLAGAADAPPSALPATTLVPALDDERPRFGHASLGTWTEEPDAARQADEAQRRAALRPWLLWTVLLAGVAGLGFMVWRLARGARAPG